MDVSIVIRTRNEAQYIGETLKRVQGQEFDGNYEVIVVDSESTDSTLEIVRNYGVRVVEIAQREFTYGRSLNIGAENAKGTFVVNLSAHALPADEKWLTNLIAGFENRDIAGVYGRQLSIAHINPFEARQNEMFFGPQKIIFNVKNTKMLKLVHFSNSNCAIRKDMWERHRFDENVPYAEDIVWRREVVEAGYSIAYAPDAAVYHTHKVNCYNAYKNSRDCAYALVLMAGKSRTILGILRDVAIFLGLIPKSILQNLTYACRNNYRQHLKIIPSFVVSAHYGWLVGRVRHRLKK